MYTCNDFPRGPGKGLPFLEIYSSKGTLEAALASAEAEGGESYVNAVVSGRTWVCS
jgi:hypothetical protein